MRETQVPAGQQIRPRLVIAGIAGLVILLPACGRGQAPRSLPTASPSTSAAGLPEGWSLCTNEVRGFQIGYPGDWHTTDVFFSERRRGDSCTVFSPEPFDLVGEQGDPLGVAVEEGCGYPVCVRFVSADLDDTFVAELTDAARVEVLVREDLDVAGWPAIRLERTVTLPTLGEPEGTYYHYLLEVRDGTILFTTPGRDIVVGDAYGHTQEVRAADYGSYKQVVDQMIATLRILPS